tara:strand:- start:446 stop:592 length:147 start_codon:yes stop_codon:yes gene_type:complete
MVIPNVILAAEKEEGEGREENGREMDVVEELDEWKQVKTNEYVDIPSR